MFEKCGKPFPANCEAVCIHEEAAKVDHVLFGHLEYLLYSAVKLESIRNHKEKGGIG